MEIYALVDNVKSLPHSLTPHVTLAYYHINGLPA
ncbi:sugar phosphate sensor protein [Streptococcus mutans 1SM1]|nr:sugar phosphate sensor protein [Streptococcus mutans 1SM1]